MTANATCRRLPKINETCMCQHVSRNFTHYSSNLETSQMPVIRRAGKWIPFYLYKEILSAVTTTEVLKSVRVRMTRRISVLRQSTLGAKEKVIPRLRSPEQEKRAWGEKSDGGSPLAGRGRRGSSWRDENTLYWDTCRSVCRLALNRNAGCVRASLSVNDTPTTPRG